MITIHTAASKGATNWARHEYDWEEFAAKFETPHNDKETAGAYVAGTLKGGRRNKSSVIDRTMLTFDADSPEPGFLQSVREFFGDSIVLAHSTFSSTPGDPRYRVVVPLATPISPENYTSIMRYAMQQIGEGSFDRSCDEGNRLMYYPAAPSPELYWHETWGDTFLNPSTILDSPGFDPLADVDLRPSGKKRDPMSLGGIPGAFNRAFRDWDALIEKFSLPYIAVEDRYLFEGAKSAPGASIIGESGEFFYSNHAHDPAYGVTCSAFDLVRIHKFGSEDTAEDLGKPVNRRASNTAMLEHASTLTEVVRESIDPQAAEEFDTVADEIDMENWKSRLKIDPKTGGLEWGPHNNNLLRLHDPVLALVSYDSLVQAIVLTDDVPWRKVTKSNNILIENDEVRLREYLQSTYNAKPSKEDSRDLVVTSAAIHESNAVVEYLRDLPEWDGTPRLGAAFPGVKRTSYTDLIARKFFTASVARALEPGCKWDHVIVIYGNEGTGKTTWVNWISRGFHSELGDIKAKDTIQNVQRAWIATIDEMGSLSGADWDAQKEFLTRTHDTYRRPYERTAATVARHFVFVATTNDREVLKNAEGNRRFLVVESQEQVQFTDLTNRRRDQIWAEAKFYYDQGETDLFITREEEESIVTPVRREYLEETPDSGVVQEYLNDPVPGTFPKWSVQDRRDWAAGQRDFAPERDNQAEHMYTCSKQLAIEALGIPVHQADRRATKRASDVMKRLPGWKQGGTRKCGPYGVQRVWVREGSTEDLV